MASNTLFLDMDKIAGNSNHGSFVGKIALNSFSYSVATGLTDDSGNSQRTTGKKTSSDFTFTKETDSSTTELYQYCLMATPIPKVTLTVGSNSGKDGEWKTTIIYILEDVLIRSVSTSGSGGLPSDTFVLNYTKVTGTYNKQEDDASTKGKTDYIFNKSTVGNK